MRTPWHTAWQGTDIVVYRDDAEVDRFAADQIERVIFAHRGLGETPGDLVFAVVELRDEYIILPAETGFAGRVHFERTHIWEDKQCVYWVTESQAPLPGRLRRGLWMMWSSPSYRRLPRTELTGSIEKWPLVGPETWEQRKWRRIERSRPFGTTSSGAFDSSLHRKQA
jgi:hypothetical protein